MHSSPILTLLSFLLTPLPHTASSNFYEVLTPQPFQRAVDPNLLIPPTTISPDPENIYYHFIDRTEKLLHQNIRDNGYDTKLIEGNTGFMYEKALYLTRVLSNPAVTSYCEVGFNAGHSAFNALLSNENVVVTSFDIGVHKERYLSASNDLLSAIFPRRLTLILGDSKVTIPNYLRDHPELVCDVIFIDGGHDYETAKADILNFQSAANKNANILILDDTNLPEVALAMKDSVELGVITNGVDGLGGVNSRYCDEFSSVRVDNWMKLEPYNCVENQGGVLAVGSYNYHNK